uniref:Uncharacterized protein n=1 Tax=Arundo donax TaxID=35708 RepID=A0A0A9B2P0_ARUDO
MLAKCLLTHDISTHSHTANGQMRIWTTCVVNVHLSYSPCKLKYVMKLPISWDCTKLVEQAFHRTANVQTKAKPTNKATEQPLAAGTVATEWRREELEARARRRNGLQATAQRCVGL